MNYLVECLVFIKTRNFSKSYSYIITEKEYHNLQKYQLAIVPFNGQIVQAIVTGKKKVEKLEFKAKKVYTIIDDRLLNPYQIELLENLYDKLVADLPDLIKLFIPLGNKLQLEVSYIYDDGSVFFLKNLNSEEKKTINLDLLAKKCQIKIDYSYKIKKKHVAIVKLNSVVYDELIKNNSLTNKQLDVLEKLKKEQEMIKSIFKKNGISQYMYSALKEKKVIYETEINQRTSIINGKKELINNEFSPDQLKVFTEIKKSEKVILLHGVTASGKSEIYFKLIEDNFQKNEQSLLLVPDSTLTLQYIELLEKKYGNQFIFLDKKMQSKEYLMHYNLIKDNKIKVVVGTKKSLFAPFDNLTLLIVDEAHDFSYPNLGNIRYNIRTFVEIFSKYKTKIILGTATPLIEDYARALNGNYQLLKLKNRFHNLKKETIDFVSTEKLLNKSTIKRIDDVLKRNGNVLIIFNKLGYSQKVQCDTCHHTPRCANCQSPLVYYKSKNKLVCHNCLFKRDYQQKCFDCQQGKYVNIGMGIEKFIEKLTRKFPENNILRIDSSMSLEQIYKVMQNFQNVRSQILVGTQMITKGIDYVNVDLAVITNIDTLLLNSNFRANEKVYQLLTQAIGRVSRLQDERNVIIETDNAQHFVMENVKLNSYHDFYLNEMKNRKLQEQIPYFNLAKIIISHKERSFLKNTANEIKEYLKTQGLEKVFVIITSYTNYMSLYRAEIKIKYQREDLSLILNNIKDKMTDKNIGIIIDINAIDEENI